MTNLERKSFSQPDRELSRPGSHGDMLDLEGMTVGRYTYEVGWRWADTIGPELGMDMCAVEHFGYVLGGRLRVRHEDGSLTEVGPGDVYRIGPRHLGEVVGDDPFETVEFMPVAHEPGATRGSAIG